MSEWFNDDQVAYMRDMAAKPKDEKCACGWYVKAECPEAKGERCYKAENARHISKRSRRHE
jgi:hypothetical protein